VKEVDSELALFGLLTYRLPPAAIRVVCNRLKVQRRTVDSLTRIQRMRAAAPALAEKLAPSRVDALLHAAEDRELITVWAAERDEQIRNHIEDYANQLRNVVPRTDGNDLIARGLKPGPEFSRILKKLRTATLDGVITTPQDEDALLNQLLLEESH
jgi:tRNA nucleotidyltransferase (CCA-adding enzyme)